MRADIILLLVCLAANNPGAPAEAEPFRSGQTLDQEQVARIAATALTFMVPRILDPVPAGQLAMWGLRGLTTLDPRLSPRLDGQTLGLFIEGGDSERLLIARPSPDTRNGAAWGEAVASLIQAGWNASEAVRRAQPEGVVRTFFDEVFNHLDPYSRYVSADEAAAEQAGLTTTAGIGARIVRRGERFFIASVEPGGPAAGAGLHPGERLLAVDGENVAGDDAQTVASSLTGPANSTVTVAVRGWDGRTRVLTMNRRVFGSPTVRAERAGSMLVLRITGFSDDTGEALAQAVKRGLAGAQRRHIRGIVLDLRDNRGGVLAQAAAAASTFLPEGLIASTIGRDPRANHTFRAEGRDLAEGLPVIVLVDGRSASAAEILAAALADLRRAVVVGSTTLGKGLVQTILPLPGGAMLYVTWSRLLAPLGWPIQGLGVLPQVCTSMGQDAIEQQFNALAVGEQPMARAITRERDARAPVPPAEALEIRAACPAAVGRDRDLDAAKYLLDRREAYAAALLGVTGR